MSIDYEAYKHTARQHAKAHRDRTRRSILEFFGPKCTRCGIDDIRVLVIDHVYGGGNKHRKAQGNTKAYYQHMRDNRSLYQVLCHNCNFLKRIENEEGKNRETGTVERDSQ